MTLKLGKKSTVAIAALLGAAGIPTANAQELCVAPPSGMVSWWDGDAVSGMDVSDIQDGNDGTLENGATTTLTGKVGSAFDLDGANDFVAIPDSPNLQFGTGDFTVDLWFFGRRGNGALVEKRVPFVSGFEFMKRSSSTLHQGTLAMYITGCGIVVESDPVTDLEWHHGAVTRENGTVKLFLDGDLVDTATCSLSVSAETYGTSIGCNSPEHGGGICSEPYEGMIDEVEIFNRALSQLEIQSIVDAGDAGKCKPGAGPEVVGIDIKPGSFPNSVNLGSGGVTPVAILGSDTLDVDDIDITTLTLGTAGIKTVGKANKYLCSTSDVSGNFSVSPEGMADGYVDLVCKFETTSIVPEVGDTTATLNGNFLAAAGGGDIEGTDSVNIVP